MIDGKIHYFPATIGREDKPLLEGIPRAAWEHLRKLEAESKAKRVQGDDPPVYYLAELYLEWAEKERDAGRMVRGHYDGQVSRLKVLLGFPGVAERRSGSVTPELMEEFFASIRPYYSANYVASVGRSVRTLFRWAAKAVPGRKPSRILAENPLTGYDFPRAPSSVREYLEGPIVRGFLRWAWARARRRSDKALMRRFDRLFVLMLWFQRLTGARPGEATTLMWTDIDWTEGKITLAPHRHKTGRKTGKVRTIYLTPPVVRLLRRIEALPGRHLTHVFTHRRGKFAALNRGHDDPIAGEPWPSGSAASAKLTDWRAAAIDAKAVEGLEGVGPRKLVAYVNRHEYASQAVNRGLSIEHTAELLGNTPAVTGTVYVKTIEAGAKKRAQEVAGRGKPPAP